MTDKNTKDIIKKNLQRMFEELDSKECSIGWVPENAEDILTQIVYNTLSYGKDVENYMEKEGMLKDENAV